MKKLIITTVTVILGFIAQQSFAGAAEGKVTLFYLDPGVANRGVCIQMDPAISGTSYACLWKDNELYNEITSLLMAGYAASKLCRLTWSTTGPSGHAKITTSLCK